MTQESDYDAALYWEGRGQYAGKRRYEPSDVDKENAKAELEHLARFVVDNQPSSILDVGCGWGRLYSFLRGQGYSRDYRMVDFVESMRLGCKNRTNILPDLWDGQTLSYPDSEFDLVLAIYTLLHVLPAAIDRAFAEHVRVSRRWLYVLTSAPVEGLLLAPHCFTHDYKRLFIDHQLRIANHVSFMNGERLCWVLERDSYEIETG